MRKVENGCDPNGIDNKGATTLHAAVSRDHVPLAAALARRGGDLTIRDEEGHRPLDLVKREQDVQDVSVGHYKAAERSPMLVRILFNAMDDAYFSWGPWILAFRGYYVYPFSRTAGMLCWCMRHTYHGTQYRPIVA